MMLLFRYFCQVMSKEIGLVLPPSEGDRVPEPSQFWRRTKEKGRKQQERKGNAAKFLAPSRRTSTEGAAGLQPNAYRVQGRALSMLEHFITGRLI